MIAFATLWLGISTGLLPVEVIAGPDVARVELRLDGRLCAALDVPPWRGRCDLGGEIAPHELVATAWSAAGEPLGEARQWLNLPRPSAEVEVAIGAAGPSGQRLAALAWAGPGGVQPVAVRAWVDGVAVVVDAAARSLALPAAPPGLTRLLRVEAEFPGGLLASEELVFGGRHAEETAIELTAVPLVEAGRRAPAGAALRSGGRELPLLALEEGEADLVVVVDPAAVSALGVLAQEAGRSRVSRGGPALAPRSLTAQDRDATHLPPDVRLRLVWPVTRSATGDDLGIRYDSFPTSPELRSADGTLLASLRRTREIPRASGEAARLADAVAVAALAASERGRRRAVLLVLGEDSGDASLYSPEVVRRYLERLRVPLHVWATGPRPASPGPWGTAVEVTSVPRLTGAARRLFTAVGRQRIAWVEGRHLPQELAPASPAGWRLAGGAGDAGPAADDAGGDAAPPAQAPEAASESAAAAPPQGAPATGAAAAPAAMTARPAGPFTLVTDVGDGRLLARLTAVAASLPEAYRERLGLAPRGSGVVLLFRREEDFRGWLAQQHGAADAAVEGFAASGAAALHAGAKAPDDVAGLMIHELAHLLTREAFGRPLPPWLEEGLAEELAMSRLDRRGGIVPASLRMERSVRPLGGPGGRLDRVERTVSGPAAGLAWLVGSPRARVPLAELLAMDLAGLSQPLRRQERYATAAFFVRFLLDHDEGRRERFHAFLATVAGGGEAGAEALSAALGEPLPATEGAFALWLRQTALAGGE